MVVDVISVLVVFGLIGVCIDHGVCAGIGDGIDRGGCVWVLVAVVVVV